MVIYFIYINYNIGKMASVKASDLSKADHDELCCSYAALMLYDDAVEITVSPLFFLSHIVVFRLRN